MPDYSDEYQKALTKARQQFLSPTGTPKRAYEQLLQVFARAILDIDSDLGEGYITKERADSLKNQINDRIITLGKRLGILLQSQKLNAINAAIDGHKIGLVTLSELSGISLTTNFALIPQEALTLMMVRRGLFGAENYATVIQRKLKGLAKDIDLIINSSIVRGVSAERASQEIAGIMVSKDSSGELQKLISKGRLKKSAVNHALKEGKISPKAYKRARRAFYDAKRIMVTEINTAFREGDLLSQERSPVVGGTKWNLSGRHKVPDLCVRKGTKIITNEGIKSVEDIKIGDKVLTHKGRFKSVIRLYRNTIQEGLINQLCFQGENNQKMDVVLTRNHPVLTDKGWIEAGDLKKDTVVYFASPKSQLWQNQRLDDTSRKEVLYSEKNEPLQGQEIENEGLYDEFHPPSLRKNNKYFLNFQKPILKHQLKSSFDSQRCYHQYNSGCSFPSFLKIVLTFSQRALTTFLAFCYRSLDFFFQTFFLYNVQKDNLSHNTLGLTRGNVQNHFRNLGMCWLQFPQLAVSHNHQADIHNCIEENKTLVLNNASSSLTYQEGFCSSYKIYQDVFLPWIYQNKPCYKIFSSLFSFLQQLRTDSVLTQSCKIHNDSLGNGLIADLMAARNIPKSKILSNKKIETSGEIVYNFEVEDDHSYTANGLVVHNCDIYATSDIFEMGEGVYPTGNYPGTPHPFCGCYPTAEIRAIEDWNKPKTGIQEPKELEAASYRKLFSKQTEHYATKQIELSNKYLKLAYQVSKRIKAA